MKVKKGDKVKIIQGKDRGRTGIVNRVFSKENMAIVEGLNMVKKHIKPDGENKKGGIIRVEKPIYASKLIVVCPACSETTRVGYHVDKQGKKSRICRKCGGLISKDAS